jgi:hypothetical protein
MKTVLAVAPAIALALVGIAAATPLACASSCVIDAATTGYTTAVFDVQQGVPLVWHSTDIGHVQQEGVTGNSGCLGVPSFGGRDSAPVVFTIASGHLLASVNGAAADACVNAQALPDGSFALPYFCEIHSTMRGALVVSP